MPNTDCSICLEPLRPNFVNLEPCKHEFDSSCLKKIIDSKKATNFSSITCPLCRGNIKSVTLHELSFLQFISSASENEAEPERKKPRIQNANVAQNRLFSPALVRYWNNESNLRSKTLVTQRINAFLVAKEANPYSSNEHIYDRLHLNDDALLSIDNDRRIAYLIAHEINIPQAQVDISDLTRLIETNVSS